MTTCPNCGAGKLHRRTINYANWHAGLYIVIPNLPAWACDVCALCQVDPDALQRLLPLIGPVTRPDLAQARHASGTALPAIDLPDDIDPDRDRRVA